MLGSKLRDKVFISYTQRGGQKKYYDELLVYLKQGELEGYLDVWSDEKLEASEDWHFEIQRAIEHCAVGVIVAS